MLQSVTNGALKVGLTKSAPSTKEIVNMAAAFVDKLDRNKDDEVSFGEFTEWASQNKDIKNVLGGFAVASLEGVARNERKKKSFKTRPSSSAHPERSSTGSTKKVVSVGSESKIAVQAQHQMANLEDRVRQGKLRLIANKYGEYGAEIITRIYKKSLCVFVQQENAT